jgi:hypothetical protein
VQTLTLELSTESAIVDQIKDCWRRYKDIDHPVSGDYYYNLIDSGIWLNKRMEINLSHLSGGLQISIEDMDTPRVMRIFIKAIYDIFCEKYGRAIATSALHEKRISIGIRKKEL